MKSIHALLLGLAGLWACRTAAPIHPRAIEHNVAGAQYLSQGDLEKAEIRFRLALEFNPDFAEAHNNLGLVELKRQHPDKAKELFIRAIRLNPDFAEAHNNLGFLYYQQSSYGKAHDEFQTALRISPDYAAARYNLALDYKALKRHERARGEYLKLIESDPDLADPHHDLCAMDLDQGELEEAIKECRAAIRLEPKFASAHFNLGAAYLRSGQFCEASDSFRTCLSLEKDHVECRQSITVANRKCALLGAVPQGDLDKEPKELYELALEERQRGLLAEAERHLERCLTKDTRFTLCSCALADLAERGSRLEEASYHCRRCLDHPDEPPPEYRSLCEGLAGTRKAEE